MLRCSAVKTRGAVLGIYCSIVDWRFHSCLALHLREINADFSCNHDLSGKDQYARVLGELIPNIAIALQSGPLASSERYDKHARLMGCTLSTVHACERIAHAEWRARCVCEHVVHASALRLCACIGR